MARGSFRAAVLRNASAQRSKAANYGHLQLPRGVNVFKEEAGGRISLDLIPYFVTDKHHPDRFEDEPQCAVEGALWYRRPYKLHRNIGAKNESVVCLAGLGKKCPICEYRANLLKAKSEGGEGLDYKDKSVQALRSSNRCIYYVVPKGSSKHDEKPYIWDISEFCFQELLNNELGENDEYGDFSELDGGLTLRIRFSAEKTPDGRNEFAKASRIDFEARDYRYDEKLIRSLTSLDDCLDVKDYSAVERLFFDTEEVDETERAERDLARRADDEGEPEKPRGSLTRPRASDDDKVTTLTRPANRARPAPEPEPEPEAEVEPEETRRPAAAPRSGPKPKPKADNDGDKCPSGYRFGVDVDKKPECEECPVWGECMDARDEAA